MGLRAPVSPAWYPVTNMDRTPTKNSVSQMMGEILLYSAAYFRCWFVPTMVTTDAQQQSDHQRGHS